MILALIQTIENESQRSAIEFLYTEYYHRLVRIADSVLHNVADAEDVVMNMFRYMCEKPEMFENCHEKSTVALLYISTKHRAIDLYRRKSKQNTLFQDLNTGNNDSRPYEISAPGPDLLEIMVNEENKEFLYKALEKLDEQLRFPIIMKYFYQMRNLDIAELLGLDTNTVNGRIFRGKKMLQKILTEIGYTQ